MQTLIRHMVVVGICLGYTIVGTSNIALAQCTAVKQQHSTNEEYCEITISQGYTRGKINAFFDFGKHTDKDIRKETHDEKNLPLQFKTKVEILNHFSSLGWTLVSTHVLNQDIREVCYVMKRSGNGTIKLSK